MAEPTAGAPLSSPGLRSLVQVLKSEQAASSPLAHIKLQLQRHSSSKSARLPVRWNRPSHCHAVTRASVGTEGPPHLGWLLGTD